MATYGKILLIAMPLFLFFVLFEKWYGWRKGNDTVNTMDMISSLTSGVTNVTKDVLGLSLAIYSYEWMVQHWAIVQISSTVWTFIIAFIALDLAGYIVHRIAHVYNVFWNSHIVHHSSEEFNLACALRQSISSIIKIFAIFLLPAALLGVPANVIAIVAPLHLFAQFWYHTQHINKMGLLENIIVTPSHHRVHHAINPEYIDKNFGQIFIIWDKVFGTFQPELENIKPVYGITRPVQTWNPVKINFMHLGLLIKDAWRTRSWKDKCRIWFMPTGWRPSDVAFDHPLYKIEDVNNFEKYHTVVSKGFMRMAWFQLIMLLFFTSYLFANISSIGSPEIYIYGLFIFLTVYALTEMMDKNQWAIFWEIVRDTFGVGLIYFYGDWFGSSRYGLVVNYFLIFYFIISIVSASWFAYRHRFSSNEEYAF